MSAPHHDHIETAFLQLSFAMKLWNYLKIRDVALISLFLTAITRTVGPKRILENE
jgi:hypothetical protein